jgi:hypothetical protein
MFPKFFGSEAAGNENLTFNYFTMVFDALNLFPEFREKMIAHDYQELEFWKEAVMRARAAGEIRSPMEDEQIAKIFLYSNDGMAVRLIMEHKLDRIRDELQGLWDNFYAQLSAKAPA